MEHEGLRIFKNSHTHTRTHLLRQGSCRVMRNRHIRWGFICVVMLPVCVCVSQCLCNDRAESCPDLCPVIQPATLCGWDTFPCQKLKQLREGKKKSRIKKAEQNINYTKVHSVLSWNKYPVSCRLQWQQLFMLHCSFFCCTEPQWKHSSQEINTPK